MKIKATESTALRQDSNSPTSPCLPVAPSPHLRVSSPGYSSLPSLCLAATLKYGKPNALNQKIGGEWINFSAETFADRVRHVALGLAALGIKRGDRVALLSENRPEWSITDLAILSL
ncbi:MAG TPA: AMP-binding protein, partial [Pyrinomonadaceae bacterium]|nr:AMP-binding protein [Pyrinomonadaceae bacterium]